jgi:hypothetical protein
MAAIPKIGVADRGDYARSYTGTVEKTTLETSRNLSHDQGETIDHPVAVPVQI